MHIEKLKVRPRRKAPVAVCAPQLASLLGCWAAHNDISSSKECADATKALFECMRKAPIRTKQPAPAINYHLARLGKTLK